MLSTFDSETRPIRQTPSVLSPKCLNSRWGDAIVRLPWGGERRWRTITRDRFQICREAQEQELQRWVRRAKTAQALVLRARIVLQTAAGKSDMEVAGQLGTTRATVGKWRRRFLRDGCDGLLDEPRPGAPRTIGDDDVERVVVQTLETIPAGATHWSTRSMAKACGLSAATVSRIWRAFGLKPHRCETFKLSRDPLVHREGTRRRGSVPASSPSARW